MFTSLRSRLLLTYALLAGFVLVIVAVGTVFYYLRPLPSRQTYQFLNLVADTIIQRSEGDGANQAMLRRISQDLDLRILVIDPEGRLLLDTGQEAGRLVLPEAFRRSNQAARDDQGTLWLYAARPLRSGFQLVIARPRPNAPLIRLVREDLLPPILNTGLAALLLALLLAFGMARWIAFPLHKLSASIQRLPSGAYQPVEVKGPDEVKALAKTYNEMAGLLQANQRVQRDFVANVSHELKTPLTSIQGFSQAILDGAASTPQELRQAAQVIHSEAGRMHRLVLDLLDLTRLDAGLAALSWEPVRLGDVIDSLEAKFSQLAQTAGVALRFDVEPLPIVQGDADRLAQVLGNLLDNAIKYTPPGGQVHVQACPDGDGVKIHVRDSGPGIAPEEIERIFERFYRGDKARQAGQGGGFGLGLAIAREIVQAHRGSISASSSPGMGSCFEVHLPAAGDKPQPTPTERPNRS